MLGQVTGPSDTAPAGTPQVGVAGQDTSPAPGGYGVSGSSTNGTGVLGTTGSVDGVGVSAQNPDGIALEVQGSARFRRCGVVQAIGTSSLPLLHKLVTIPGANLTKLSLVLATIQGEGVSGVAIKGVETHPDTKTFTIYLTNDLKTTMQIAWFVLEAPFADVRP